jgi:hypothetical protein
MSAFSASPPASEASRPLIMVLLAGMAAWFATVLWAAGSGALGGVDPPLIAPMVAAGIAAPVALYAAVPGIRRLFAGWGLRPLTLPHAWRIAAALVFFWYGAQGLLPPAFWLLAGLGDLVTGLAALRFLGAPRDAAAYRRFHALGFVDFIIAVGAGLTFTLLGDPRMAAVRELPLALIPLFGVGLSGASHIIAFDLMRRGHPRG